MRSQINRQKSIIPVILIIVAAFAVIFLAIPLAFRLLQRLTAGPGFIMVIPEPFSNKTSGLVIALSLMFLTIPVSALTKPGKEKIGLHRNRAHLRMVLLMVLFIICMSGLLFAFSSLYRYTAVMPRGFTVSKGLIPVKRNYSFNDVTHVRLGYFRGRNIRFARYILTMKDGTAVNIASDGIYPELFMEIEKRLPPDVKRECGPDGRSRIIDKMPPQAREFYNGLYPVVNDIN